MSEQFHCQLLTQDSIRLFRITSLRADGLCVDVSQARLDSEVEFDCLSYVWGTSIFDSEICNSDGVALNITTTLASTLRRLFDVGHRRLIWADGICINQTDHGERVQQVQLMRSIYGKAKTVLADLGEAFEGSSAAIDLCAAVVSHKDNLAKASTLFPNSKLSFPPGLPPITNSSWAAFRRLIARPWFTRIWIIQEFLVGNDVQMLCGHKKFDSSTMFEAARLVFHHQLLGYDRRVYTDPQHNRDFNAAMDAAAHVRMLQTSKERLVYKKTLDLPLFLQRGVLFGATDPRDRFFAVSSLSTLEPSQDTVPDYKAEAMIIFKRLVRHLSRSDRLILIELLHSIGLPRSDVSWPSWLPDWTTKSDSQSLETFRSKGSGGSVAQAYFRAGIARETLEHRVFPKVDLSADMRVLSLRCVIVDTVEAVCGDLFVLLDADMSDNVARARILKTWLTDAVSLAGLTHAEEDDIWRTLIANVSNTERSNDLQLASPPSESFLRHFRNFKDYVLDLLVDEDADDLAASAATFLSTMGYVMRGRVFGLTSRGRLCLVPANAQKDDVVVIIIGASCPFLARESQSTNMAEDMSNHLEYSILGHGYVHGLMKSEVFSQDNWQLESLNFV